MISELPTRAPLEEFDTRLKSQRSLPAPISDMIGALQHAHPMEVLRTCVSALGAYAASRNDNASEAIIQKGIRLTSQLPMMVRRPRPDSKRQRPGRARCHTQPRSAFFYQLSGEISDDAATELFVPIFAIGRIPGWVAQVVEHSETNILIRSLTLYNGPQPRDYIPINARGTDRWLMCGL